MVVCAPICVCQERQRCWVFKQQFPVFIKNGPSPSKRHPANLTQLWEALESPWASIPVERFRHLEDSMPDELKLFWGQKWVQLNIRKVFQMVCVLGVYKTQENQDFWLCWAFKPYPEMTNTPTMDAIVWGWCWAFWHKTEKGTVWWKMLYIYCRFKSRHVTWSCKTDPSLEEWTS